MASRISQMRNAVPQQPQQQSLNESIMQTKALMHQLSTMQDPQAALVELLQSNPQLSALLSNQNHLENFARQMARNKGYDIMDILKQLNT